MAILVSRNQTLTWGFSTLSPHPLTPLSIFLICLQISLSRTSIPYTCTFTPCAIFFCAQMGNANATSSSARSNGGDSHHQRPSSDSVHSSPSPNLFTPQVSISCLSYIYYLSLSLALASTYMRILPSTVGLILPEAPLVLLTCSPLRLLMQSFELFFPLKNCWTFFDFGFRWRMRILKKTTPLELTHIPHHPRQDLTAVKSSLKKRWACLFIFIFMVWNLLCVFLSCRSFIQMHTTCARWLKVLKFESFYEWMNTFF